MKFIKNVLFVLGAVMLINFQAMAEKNSPLPLYSQVYDEQRNAFDDANAALKLADKTNRNVLMVIGGNWCAFCKKMEAFWQSDTEVAQALYNNYVILKINVSDKNENKEFMSSMPPIYGYPHIYIANARGKMLLSKDTAELQVNEQHDTQLWLAFIDRWKADKEQAKAVIEIIAKESSNI
ncbi:MAG: thioredoxin family protein [Colwellia sp.]|nr:thioredoxin family protein [Colwellia sp.]